MKCPYCAEEINDSAIVCRFCHRDFALLAPLLHRLSVIETQLEQHVQATETQTKMASQPQDRKIREGGSQVIPGIFMVAVASGGSLGLYWLAKAFLSIPVLILAVIVPFVVGVAAGFWMRGGHAKMYLILGLIVGAIDYAGALGIIFASSHHLAHDWLSAGAFIVLGPAALFALGGILADWVEKRYFPERYQSGFGTRLALSLATITGKPGSPRNVEVWKGIVSALTPILSILGSIIAAYLTYLTALARK